MTPSPTSKLNPLEHLPTIWEQFVKAPSPSYEKSQWMDMFLGTILTQLREEKNIQEILSFCTTGLAGTLLSCELLSDVHQLCQQPGRHEDDTQPLQNYLLESRGTRCLLAIHALGSQGISCGRELAGLLISLYPICLQTPVKEADLRKNEFFTSKPENDFENIFKIKQNSRQKGWSVGSLLPRLSNSSATSSVRLRRKRSSAGSVPPPPPQSGSSESEECVEMEFDFSPALAPTLRIQLNPMDFDYFTSVVRSEDESERRRSIRTVDIEDFTTDEISQAMKTELSVFELCQLLLSLIKKLCISEPTDSSCQTSVQAINFALENLCSLQFGSSTLSSSEQTSQLKCTLVGLLLTALERCLQHSDATTTVIHSGMLPLLLRVVEDAVRKCGQSQDDITQDEIINNQDFIYATINGSLTFLYTLLKQNEKPQDFMKLFKLVTESQGGKLIENAISVIIKTPNVKKCISITRAKKLVNLVGLIISMLKKYRSEVAHTQQCKRYRHKQCCVIEKFHHFNLGSQSCNTVNSNCGVAAMFLTLLRISQSCASSEVELRAAKVMNQCGACCCLPPRTILIPSLELASHVEPKVRAALLAMLDKVVFSELGCSDPTASCEVCVSRTLRYFPENSSAYTPEDSLIGATISQNTASKNCWECLSTYKDLLESQNSQLSVTIADHLFKIIPNTSINVKRELLFQVFYPTFLNQKTVYFENDDDEMSKFLMLCCLSILSSQLCNVEFAEEFIMKGGLDFIIELITIPEFSKLCCSILEVTIVIELWKLEGENEKKEGEPQSLKMLMQALQTSSTTLLGSLQRCVARQLREEREELPSTSRESDSGCLTEHTDSSDANADPLPGKHVMLQQLGSAVVFWRACASLVACSPHFRTYLTQHEMSEEAHRLLQLVVRMAVRGPARGDDEYSKGSESYLTLRLLEALITVCLGIHLPVSELSAEDSQTDHSDQPHVLRTVRQAVLSLKPKGRTHVQALCDMLLRCAATHYYEQQVLPARSKPELPALPTSFGETSITAHLEGEEVEGGSSLDDSYLTADEGYEADVEIPEGAAESTIDSFILGEDALSPLLSSLGQRGISAVSKPELCCLVLALLVQLYEEAPASLCPSLVHALQRLATLCRDSPHNCVTLAKHGVIATLLSGFSSCLKIRDVQHAELQRVILDLVSLLARYSISPQELALYLDFFKAKDPPCEALLWPLVTLASYTRPQPHFILCFPAEIGSLKSNCDVSGESEHLACYLHERHRKNGTHSSWSSAPLALPLNSSLGWSMWTNGFSLSLWLRLESTTREPVGSSCSNSPRHSTVSVSSDSAGSEWGIINHGSSRGSLTDSMKSAQCGDVERLLHIFSVGGESITLEGWADPASDVVCLRLCRCDNASYEVLDESVINNCLPKGSWHHLAVNVTDFMQNKKTVVQVVLIVDGWKEIKIELKFSGLLVRKSRPSCLLLGHSVTSKSSASGSWYLGNVMLFRSPVFTRERAMHVAGLGPNQTNLTECEASSIKPNFSPLFSPRTVSCGLNWESILDGTNSNLKFLQESLLLTYTAQNSSVVQIYPVVITSPGGTVGSLFPPSQQGFRVIATEQRASQQVPLSLAPVFLLGDGEKITAQQFRGLAAAANLLGGIQVFLVLFARVVELKCQEIEQAHALSLLLRLAQSDADLFSQLASCHKLLLRVLESPNCTAGPLVLKSLLDACCDRTLMPQQPPAGEISVSHAADSIVINSFLLATGVRAWRAWDSPALECLFRALHALLRDDHPYREFNSAQLNRARLVETLLLFCKEKFLYEDKEECGPQLPAAVSCSLVELVRSLMGAPPEFSHVVAVADFLLLLHRASATYVSHSRSNFYFLLSFDEQNKQGPYYNISMKKPKIELGQPIDPLKLNKALTNLHIKQNGGDTGQETGGDLESLDSNRVEEEQDSSVDQNMDNNGINSFAYSNDSGLPFYPSITEEEERGPIRKEEQWEKFTEETGLKEGEWEGEKANSQCLVVEGLLLLLRDTILVLPDSMSHQVLNHVVRAEILLAMANHSDSRVRTAVVRVLSAYLQRATDEEVNKFLKLKGFYLLANQLSQFEASAELVEACVALITHCQVSLEEQTELYSLKDMTSLQVASFPPLLALLPRSIGDTALCHNTVFFLREVITKVPQSYRPLLDSGLLETLGRTLLAVSHLPPDPSDLCGVSEQDLIIGDIYVFLVTIVGRAISQPGSQNLQGVNEVLLQLGMLERQERLRCGLPSRCAQTMRDAQCSVLEGILDRLQERGCINQPTGSKNKPSASFLAAMISSGSEDSSPHPTLGNLSAQHVMTLSGQLRDVPRGEVNERVKLFIHRAVEFTVSVEPVTGQYRVSETEAGFARSLFLLLLRALASTLEKQPRPAARTPWQGAVWAIKDSVRVLAGQLLTFLLSPRQPPRVRMFVIHTLHGEPRCRDLLSSMLQANAQVDHRFSVFFRDLLVPHRCVPLTNSDIRMCEALLGQLQSWGLICARLGPLDPALWTEELALLHEELDRQRIVNNKQSEAAQLRSALRQESLAKSVAEAAMLATRAAVEAQNGERKAFMEHIKAAHSESVQLRAQWYRIVQQFTHERAVWFFPESYPRSWQLDPTEGPGRVRNRLQRCHLGIREKYLMPEYQHKLEALDCPSPLSFLFEQEGRGNSSVLIERLHTNEKIRHMTAAQVVTPAQEVPGELLVGETCLYFVSDELESGLETSLDAASMAWHFEDVKEIQQRRFQLQERALEVFLTNGKTYFLAFQSSKEKDEFLQVVLQCPLPNLQQGDALNDVMNLWREGLISNFEYLSQLNKLSGRSFNDLMQYPVCPFVMADYTSPKLDLSSPAIYRNFEKPMAVQDKKNEQHYINTYNYLKQELQCGMSTISINQEPFHYGSHYSNSGTVLHFLVRMPPFTRMFLTYQDNNFDIPDRTFHSLHTTWRLTSSDSTTDVKELIPEFFFLPEFLLNSEGFSLGIRQSGERVHHVMLPSWCQGDPRTFMLVHRQALESDYVRENLPHWIDLVFGYKQTGKPAVDAINVFHPATYYGFDVESIKDPLERTAWETMVRTYGQTPKLLFRGPHPMVIQALAGKSAKAGSTIQPPLGGAVQNLRWGSYVGSPAEGEPKIEWKHAHRAPVAGLVPLRNNDVFGLAPCTSLLLSHQGRGGFLGTPSVQGAALISWGHADGVVRAKMRKEQPPRPLLQAPGLDPVVLCSSVPDLPQLWIALASGRLLVLRLSFQPARGMLETRGSPLQLLGHNSPVLSLALCRAFSIAVSGSQDGTAIIWDLNTLSYVRTIPSAGAPVQQVAVSDVSGDIATSGPAGTGSCLRLYTVNASLVGKVSCEEQVCSLCFSCAPEGLAINVIAAGLNTGDVKMWNTWDLTPVRKITCDFLHSPIISLVYSHDAQHLYASSADGTVVIWEATGSRGKTAKFLNLTSL